MISYATPSFITCMFLGFYNNNPVLNGGIKFTCIYSLTPNLLHALRIKNGIAHTAYQSNIQATVSSIKLHWGSPKIKAC